MSLVVSSCTPGSDSTTDAVSGTVEREDEEQAEDQQAKSNQTNELLVESTEDDEDNDLFDPLEEINPKSLPEPRRKNQFKCTECEKVCRNSWLLDKHMKARHNNIDEVADSGKTCPYCKRVFLASFSRAPHMLVCHKKPRVDDCDCSGVCSGHNSANTTTPARAAETAFLPSGLGGGL